MAERKTFDHTSGHFILCGDAKIYVEEIGSRELPILLVLHGGFGNIEDFNTITPALSCHFRLIGIDSRGHGKSSLGMAMLSYKLFSEDIARVVDSLGLQEFSILGFSDGGITAYRFAANRDSRLRKIVAVGSSWEMSQSDPAWEMYNDMTGEIWKDTFPDSYESYLRLNPEPDFDRFSGALISAWTDLSPDGYPGALVCVIPNDMLIVRGDNDPLTTIEGLAKLRGMAENRSFLNIPFAEHVAFDDAPAIFLDALGKFFGVSLAES